MNKVMLAQLKAQTLTLDKETGVTSNYFNGVNDLVRKNMGADSSMVLSDSMEVDEEGNYFFPNSGDGILVWKRMLAAYKEEKALDKAGK
jgi:hypothetical protein